MTTTEDDCVFIGKKPTMSYVFAVQTQAQTQKQVTIMARGRSISKAADVAEIALHRFLKGWGKGEITLGTHEKLNEEKNERVTFIQINLLKEEK